MSHEAGKNRKRVAINSNYSSTAIDAKSKNAVWHIFGLNLFYLRIFDLQLN